MTEMSPAEAIFFAAAEKLAEERAAYLAEACGGDAQLRQRVERMLAARPHAKGFLEPRAATGDAATATFCSASDAPTSNFPGKDEHAGAEIAGKYTLVEVIGEGGMGNVWRAKQTEPVKRFVAVKLIKAGMDSKQVLSRFEAERQALALMDHPNIAKVLDGGLHDHRPFFVMELVKGMPITEYCDHHKLTPRDRLELFVPVCQAIQHAHLKGIIHRDIKPSNVLVALYDDKPVVKVIDFGVAKATGGVLTEHTLDTGFGGVVGTPQYMSPEQATFNNLDIDTRSDVYALGVLLYELLTGSPPFARKEMEKKGLLEILRVVREEEPPRPSTKLSTADALPTLSANRGTEPKTLTGLLRNELDWIVMKALEKDRTRRYETANGFAADVRRYLSGEAVQAHPPSAGYKFKKFVRRNPFQLAMAGMAAVLVLGGVSVAWWQAEQAGTRREADLRRQLQDEQRASADAARLARNAEAVASLLGQAEESLKANDAAKAAVVLEAARKRAAEGGAERDADRLKRLDADLALLQDLDAIDQFRWTWEENKFQDPAVVATRTREALTRFGADPDTVAVDDAAARVSASVVRERIVAALDRLLRQQKTAGVRAALRKVDADPYRDAVRDADLANDREKIVALASQQAALEQPPGFAAFLGESSAIPVERKRQLLQVAVSRRPGDLGLLMTLGNSHPINQEDGADERLRWFQAAVAAAPANTAAHTNLGTVLRDKKDREGAEAAYREAIRFDPKNAAAHTNLGTVLRDKKDREGAEAAYREAIRLDPKLAPAHTNLGTVLRDKKDREGAEAAYREAIRLDPKLAPAHTNLGTVLRDKKDREGAEAALREALRLDPKNANAHNNLGLVLRDKADREGAEAAYREAIRLDPKLAMAHYNLGLVLRDKKDLVGAEAAYREAIRLDPKYAMAHTNLGNVLRDKKDLEGAEAAYREAIRLVPKFAEAHSNLGVVLGDKRDLVGAEAACREAIRLDPKFAGAHKGLGVVLGDKRDLVGAEAALREAIRLDPKDAKAHYNLGVVIVANSDREGAEAAYREAIRLDPKYAAAHTNLGAVLQAKPDLVGAEAAYREAIRLDPKEAKAHYNLGVVLLANSDLVGAEAALREAIRLDPKYAPAHNGLGNVLRDKADRVGAEAAYREAIRLDPKLTMAHYSLGLVLLASGRYADAKASWDRAMTLLPEKHPARTQASRLMQVCDRMLKLEARLPKLLRGEDKVDSSQERLDVLQMCQHKKLYAAGARFSAEAFAADPKLADDLQSSHRYNAACYAALAAAGQGDDAGKLDDATKVKLRGQALDWLKADLAAWGKLLDSGPPQTRPTIVSQMSHWQTDPDLAGIRDAAALAKLPADEQKASAQLWADVAALLKKAEEKPSPPPAAREPEKKPEPAPPPREKK